MRILKGFLFVILMITAVFSGVILYCIIRPDLAQALAERFNNRLGLVYVSSVSGASVSEDTSGNSFLPDDISGNTVDMSDYEGLAGFPLSDYEVTYDEPSGVPEEYLSKTGCTPVSVNEIPVTDSEAEEIENTLSAGNTGDGLTFDGLFYPYYHMLDEEGQALYRQIYANANDLTASFAPVGEPNVKRLRTAFVAVCNDHPELFWMNTAYSCLYSPSGKCSEMDLSFNRTADDHGSAQAEFESAAEAILNNARNLSSDYEKEKYIHQTLIDKITYDLNAEMNQSAYSALVNGNTVCAGYARAFQYLCTALNIPAYYCAGSAGEPHAWNIIKLGDDYYNVDTTWDDTPGREFDYFNKSDRIFRPTHRRRELSVYLPACSGEEYSDLEQSVQPTDEASSASVDAAEEPAPSGDHLIISAYENTLNSLENYNLSENDLLYDLDSYYKEADRNIREHDTGSYEFLTAIHGRELMEQIRNSNRTGEYKDAYLQNALMDIGAKSCMIKMQIEELRGENYLIRHLVEIK